MKYYISLAISLIIYEPLDYNSKLLLDKLKFLQEIFDDSLKDVLVRQ